VSALIFLAACGGGGSGSNTPTTGGGGGGGGNGSNPTGANYTTCNSQQVPNWRYSAFQSNYQAAIQALVNHYKNNSTIGYIRIGLGRGGEINLPQGWNDSSSGVCYAGYTGNWGYTVGGDASFTWNSYLQSMVQYEGALGSPKELLVSITPVTGAGKDVDDFIAPIAVANGMSFGNQGLEASDITNFPNCGGDWCNLFAQYPSTPSSPIRELQTIGQSCPENAPCPNSLATSTGPLDPLLPFAVLNGANDLELYYQDWLIAFDPTYANSASASADSAVYEAAIVAAQLAGAKMQVLFPPQSGGTDFSDVQTYLMNNNPAVDGTVIDVDWSDIDIGDASSGTHTNYDFTISDSVIQQYAGKTVNLVFQNTTYAGDTCPANGIGSNGQSGIGNCAMPSWMWTVLK
jgi:hypothetical protein